VVTGVVGDVDVMLYELEWDEEEELGVFIVETVGLGGVVEWIMIVGTGDRGGVGGLSYTTGNPDQHEIRQVRPLISTNARNKKRRIKTRTLTGLDIC